MDLPRKIGVGIVMIIPGFVTGGLVYSLLHSWFGVLVMEIIVAGCCWAVVTGKFKTALQKS
ncbi:MAG: hypothetical protein JRF59_02305 [Deltaproteobacteria bacterium]|mgnify:CR=1 FL=1|nr:hypothetical protein [Deltaproteobacteria bacterium]MBW1949637.1 hypothetical protein [Deltaproteobacteria bacterium]MBW2346661.1 hypothetical protein [Deltaproteobacteria bacterium]RLB32813.1 MAG: hypothetical protein DRH20_14290 [Deltaproteobacteria bacterium]